MRKVRHRARAFQCLTAALLAVGAASYCQETGAAKESGMSAFGRLIPLGYVNRQVRIPTFGNDGKIGSILTAETLIRIDDDRLQAGKSTVEIAGKQPAENIRVDLMTAMYHMSDRTLRSGDRSRVSRADFQVEGDSMVFDAATSVGRMKGHVRTIIFDTDALSGKSKGIQQPAN